MAKRKVIQTGTGSFNITIPMIWAKKYQIQKGSELNAEAAGNKLVLTVEPPKGFEEQKVIEQEECRHYESRVIGKLYMAGYNSIRLNLASADRVEYIKTELKTVYPGLMLTEEGPRHLSFRCTLAEEEALHKSFEKKAFQSGLQLAKEMLELIEKKRYKELKKMKNYELLNTQFCNFCERYLNKKGSRNYAFAYVTIWGLEKVVDEYEYLTHFLMDYQPILSKEVLAYFRKTNEFFEKFYKLYLDYNTPLFSKMYKSRKLLVKEGYGLMLTKSNKEAVVVSHLMVIIKMIFDLAGNVLGKKVS